MSEFVGSILGWIGTIGTFSAYLLLMHGRLSSETLRYSLLNAIGGLLASAGAFVFGAWPAVVSNVLWAGIGVHGVITALRRRRSSRIELGPETGLIPTVS